MRNPFPRLRRLVDVVSAFPGNVSWPSVQRQPIPIPVRIRPNQPLRRR